MKLSVSTKSVSIHLLHLVRPRHSSICCFSRLGIASQTINWESIHLDEIMDISMAEFLLACCKLKVLNTLYDNPVEDSPCKCSRCIKDPPTKAPVTVLASIVCPNRQDPSLTRSKQKHQHGEGSQWLKQLQRTYVLLDHLN